MNPVESVIAREDEFYAAQTASDVAKLDAIMSDSLTRFVHTTGVVDTKAEYLAAVRSGRYRHGSITRLHGQTRVFGDAAVSIGVIDMVSKPEGAPQVSMRFHQVLVWVREAAGWCLTLRQATRQML
ncbi:MAG: nuclear transport factor 2 family protein [Rhodopila sp.]|nr:nuclear transport factor 2 family protein [Rhodopila sp.]